MVEQKDMIKKSFKTNYTKMKTTRLTWSASGIDLSGTFGSSARMWVISSKISSWPGLETTSWFESSSRSTTDTTSPTAKDGAAKSENLSFWKKNSKESQHFILASFSLAICYVTIFFSSSGYVQNGLILEKRKLVEAGRLIDKIALT